MLTILTLQIYVWMVAGVVALVALAVQRIRRGPRRHAVSRGAPRFELTAAELAWIDACNLARDLAAGVLPAPRDLWAVVPYPGEVAYLELPVLYSRYCTWRRVGPNYRPSRYYWIGQGPGSGALAFTYAADALCEAVQYRRDRELATPQWRGHEHTRVVLTDQRILVLASLPENRPEWVSMNISGIREFCPDLLLNRLEVRFYDGVWPLRLEGPVAPIVAAWLGWALYGAEGLRSHPGLRELLA